MDIQISIASYKNDEIWRGIVGFENLALVSNYGRIYHLPKQWIISYETIRKHDGIVTFGNINSKGYLQVSLRKNGIGYKRLVHRLVAETFIDNLKNLPQIDHINGNKEDNSVINLRWCDNYTNCNYSNKESKKNKTSKKVGVIYNKNNKKWQSYISINSKYNHLGYFTNEEDAILSRRNAELKYNLKLD
jgi:hypothetical protein